jgi:hypothetical protein
LVPYDNHIDTGNEDNESDAYEDNENDTDDNNEHELENDENAELFDCIVVFGSTVPVDSFYLWNLSNKNTCCHSVIHPTLLSFVI